MTTDTNMDDLKSKKIPKQTTPTEVPVKPASFLPLPGCRSVDVAKVIGSHPYLHLEGVFGHSAKATVSKEGNYYISDRGLDVRITNEVMPNAIMLRHDTNGKPCITLNAEAMKAMSRDRAQDCVSDALAYALGGDLSKLAKTA